MKYLAVVFILLFSIHSAQASVESDPDVNDVQRAALDYARIKPDELSGLKKRARMAASLPLFQIAARRAMQNNVNVEINDNISVTSTGVNVGPESSDIQQVSNNDTYIEVKAVWRLNELIFSRDMLDVSEEARNQIRERRQILAEVNKLYFERQRLLESSQNGSGLREITAGLDALTGGWFSSRIKN